MLKLQALPPMRKPCSWLPFLLCSALGACVASRPDYNPQQVQLTLTAQSPEAYNIVWLRATLRNNSSYSVWLPDLRDSIYAWRPGGSRPLVLQGLTPKGAELIQCVPGIYDPIPPRYTELPPQAERTVHVRVDLNTMFPKSFLDSLAAHHPEGPLVGTFACAQYVNRTIGPYQFSVRALGLVGRRPSGPYQYLDKLRRNQYRLEAHSNTVTVRRKQ